MTRAACRNRNASACHAALIAAVIMAGCAGRDGRVLAVADKIQMPKTIRNLDDLRVPAASLSERDFSTTRLRRYSDKTIDRLYQSLGRVTFFLAEQHRYVGFQQNLLAEKIRRKTQTESDVADMYAAYVGARMFENAKDLRMQFPDIRFPDVPDVVVSSGVSKATRWRVYEVSERGNRAELAALHLDHGVKIVLVMLTGCQIAERAMTKVLADKEFSGEFRANGLLLTDRFDSVGVANWKSHFDFNNVYIVKAAGDFPGFDFLSSPQFYFLKDGEILYHFKGWGDGEGSPAPARFRRGLEALHRRTPVSSTP